MKNKIIFLGLISSLLLMGAGCSKVQVVSNDGGVYKSFDNGTRWEQKVAVLSVGQPKSIATINVAKLVFDPSDANLLYAVSSDGRLFTTLDAAESWQELTKVPKGIINSIAFNLQTGETVYLAIGNKIYKSDCSCRSWQNVYLEALPNIQVMALAVDGGDVNKVLAGLSDGRIIKSSDGGNNWSTFYDFKNKIAQIMFSPNSTGVIYVNTNGGGLWRSTDAGNSWQNLDQNLKSFRGGRDVSLMVADATRPDS
ncbi:MAG: YCF48-related protein, partial [Patescibacteria group bacterium]|nr:YCF48-related protein [Patescibacteria group bacterium]